MKRFLLVTLLVGCDPGPDIDIGPIDLGGYTIGDRGRVAFALAEGCPTDSLFGCSTVLPAIAVGAVPAFTTAPIDGSDDTLARQLDTAVARSTFTGTATATRDANGLLVVTAVAPGSTKIELVSDGDVIDSIALTVDKVESLSAPESDSNTVLAGARIGARVEARGTHGVLYARGAITATASGMLAIDDEPGGFFSASEQVAVRAAAPGGATMTFEANGQTLHVPYSVVGRGELTRLELGGLPLDASTEAHTLLVASAYVGDTLVRGGGACDWQILVGGGANAALAARDGDDTNASLFPIYTLAEVYGQGDITVECRASAGLVSKVTAKLHP